MGEWAGAYAEQLRADAAWHAGDAVASAASGQLSEHGAALRAQVATQLPARRVPAALGHARGAERGDRRLGELARVCVPAYAGRRPGFRTAVARPVSISVGALPPRTCALPGLEPHVDRRRPRTAPVCPATAAHRAVARGRGARRGAGSCGGSGPSRVGARAGEARARAGPTRCARRDPSRVQQAAWSRDSDAGHQRTLPGQAPRLACSPGSLALCVCKKVLARRCV